MSVAAAAGPPLTGLLIIAASASCYVFLVLLPLYFKDRSSAGLPDARSAHLRTAALLLLVVGVFLTAFTASIRLNYGGNASSVLGIEAAAYFATATVVLLLARRLSPGSHGQRPPKGASPPLPVAPDGAPGPASGAGPPSTGPPPSPPGDGR